MGVAKHNGVLALLTPVSLLGLALAILAALCTIRAFNLLFFFKLSQFREKGGDPLPDTIVRAVILATNQKTLPISIVVLMQLSNDIGSGVGLAMLACILAHFTQVILDSLLVDHWQHKDNALKAKLA
jgi:hypothetical protein